MKDRGWTVWMCVAGALTIAGLVLNVFPIEFPGEWSLRWGGPPSDSARLIGQIHLLVQQLLLYGGGFALALLAVLTENRRSERAVRDAVERLEE